MRSGLFKNVINKMCFQKNIFNVYKMYKEDLAFNNLQWLICHQTKPNSDNLHTSFKYSFLILIIFK